jgi:hypothetical protein
MGFTRLPHQLHHRRSVPRRGLPRMFAPRGGTRVRGDEGFFHGLGILRRRRRRRHWRPYGMRRRGGGRTGRRHLGSRRHPPEHSRRHDGRAPCARMDRGTDAGTGHVLRMPRSRGPRQISDWRLSDWQHTKLRVDSASAVGGLAFHPSTDVGCFRLRTLRLRWIEVLLLLIVQDGADLVRRPALQRARGRYALCGRQHRIAPDSLHRDALILQNFPQFGPLSRVEIQRLREHRDAAIDRRPRRSRLRGRRRSRCEQYTEHHRSA